MTDAPQLPDADECKKRIEELSQELRKWRAFLKVLEASPEAEK